MSLQWSSLFRLVERLLEGYDRRLSRMTTPRDGSSMLALRSVVNTRLPIFAPQRTTAQAKFRSIGATRHFGRNGAHILTSRSMYLMVY
jgi:hypothetical protein